MNGDRLIVFDAQARNGKGVLASVIFFGNAETITKTFL